MKKLVKKFLGIAALTVVVGSAQAIPVSVTFTGDNVVAFGAACATPTGITGCSGGSTIFDLTGASNTTDWRVADTITVDLAEGNYWMSFKVLNRGGASSGNPGSFLAEIGGGAWGDVLTSSAWQVDRTRPSNFPSPFDEWDSATEYGANGGTNIWTGANGGNPIAGISTDAQWIWDSTNYEGEEYITVRGLVTVPEPSVIALFGLGLVAIGFVARRRKA